MNNLGCSFLEEGINFDFNSVYDCCISHNNGKGLPILIENYNGEPINWENIFIKKGKRVAAQKEKTIPECENCYRMKEYTFLNEKKISEFHFSQCQACNARCIYCSDERSGTNINYDTYKIIKDLFEKGYYKPGGEATFQGGEPTLMPHFNELIHLFQSGGTKVRVHTNGIKYSPSVYEALKNDNGTAVISLDCGCREIYNKIKNVDAFNCVIENIKKYSSANPNNVVLKYILIPGINDNLEEIDKFFNIVKEFDIKNVALDIEVQYARKYDNKNVSQHIYLLFDYFEKKTKELKINFLIYSFFSYVLKNRHIKPSKLIKYKFLYKLLLNKLNDKSKNLEYIR